ncbi:BTB/POZ domain-containing protein At5g66560 [Magnolia sinica]|uniref:BTB/POZ domain-containing protein At5g66560 n=1 Tax=Magnolia sinica TaxID=86752 RepID=UPI0026585BD4|nr:BTB/POZ domain-containing protein At5g66560 [Magnolia sinica]
MATEKLGSKGQAWFCTTGLPSDIVIEVDEMTFHLHKFPLMAKSQKLHELMTEQESNPERKKISAEGIEEEGEEEICCISLSEFPGGSEAFEAAAKFCYGVKIELTPSNVAPLRCAGEYLEMTEEFSEDNLISKTERFLTQSVFRNLRDCIETLKSCDNLMPLAEALSIPQRCIESIATRASSSDLPSSALFGWPVNDEARGDQKLTSQILWNGIDTGIRPKNLVRSSASDSWFEDLTGLSLPLYKQLISAMKARDLSSDVIEGALVSYAKRLIPGLSRSSRKQSSGSMASEFEQRELLETVIMNLPLKRRTATGSAAPTTTRFLFGLLRTANILRASEDCRATLERRIGQQLEQATLDDLLLPSYSYLIETLYDVDCVERILMHFLEGLDERSTVGISNRHGDHEESGRSPPPINPVMLVGKLIDGYLSEIASDANLKPEKFYDLAFALPDHARLFDDGLYRAIDVYLKAHPWISQEDREKLCGVMDCQKLTLEACTHAAQNERLPLRAVVQVLFFEQLQLRHAIAGSILATDAAGPPLPLDSARSSGVGAGAVALPGDGGDTWQAAIRENQVLRLDMDSMRSRVQELERECTTMRKAIEKIDKGVVGGGNAGGWSSFTKKFGCKFKTQVCDSHERAVVEARKVRQQQLQERQQSL